MKVAIFGSQDWDDYNYLMRILTVFIQESHELGHEELTFVHSGRRGAEMMIIEYTDKVKRMLRQNGFKIKEELFKDRSNLADINLIESGIDFALVFSTKDGRTHRSKKALDAYGIPHRIIESA